MFQNLSFSSWVGLIMGLIFALAVCSLILAYHALRPPFDPVAIRAVGWRVVDAIWQPRENSRYHETFLRPYFVLTEAGGEKGDPAASVVQSLTPPVFGDNVEPLTTMQVGDCSIRIAAEKDCPGFVAVWSSGERHYWVFVHYISCKNSTCSAGRDNNPNLYRATIELLRDLVQQGGM